VSYHVLKYGMELWECSCGQWSFNPEWQRTGRSGVLEYEKHRRANAEIVDELETVLLPCDEKCGALRDPVTLEEYQQTVGHYQLHSYMHGCPACGS